MAMADALGIARRLERRPDELSGGEQQRAAVAQALASGATVVVADEPTAELDSEAADGVLASHRRARRHEGSPSCSRPTTAR